MKYTIEFKQQIVALALQESQKEKSQENIT